MQGLNFDFQPILPQEDSFTVLRRDYSDTDNPNAKYYSHTVIYPSIITPQPSCWYTTVIDGITYSGTLSLSSYYYSGGKTYATYSGMLYVSN